MSEETAQTKSAVPETDYFEESESMKPLVKEGKLVEIRSEQEKTRAWIAKALVIIFGSTIGGVLFFISIEVLFPHNVSKEDLKDISTLILISETGIVGTVLGFYFGNHSKN